MAPPPLPPLRPVQLSPTIITTMAEDLPHHSTCEFMAPFTPRNPLLSPFRSHRPRFFDSIAMLPPLPFRDQLSQVHLSRDVILIVIRLVCHHPSLFRLAQALPTAHRRGHPRRRRCASSCGPHESPSRYRRETKAVGGPGVPRVRRRVARYYRACYGLIPLFVPSHLHHFIT